MRGGLLESMLCINSFNPHPLACFPPCAVSISSCSTWYSVVLPFSRLQLRLFIYQTSTTTLTLFLHLGSELCHGYTSPTPNLIQMIIYEFVLEFYELMNFFKSKKRKRNKPGTKPKSTNHIISTRFQI